MGAMGCDERVRALARSMRRRNGSARRRVHPAPIEEARMQEREREREETERGQPASFDPVSGEVHGSGSGAGGGGNPNEDYDSDPMAGSGSEPAGGPRPRSDAVDRPIDPDEGV
jgi:hypothetical protein